MLFQPPTRQSTEKKRMKKKKEIPKQNNHVTMCALDDAFGSKRGTFAYTKGKHIHNKIMLHTHLNNFFFVFSIFSLHSFFVCREMI